MSCVKTGIIVMENDSLPLNKEILFVQSCFQTMKFILEEISGGCLIIV